MYITTYTLLLQSPIMLDVHCDSCLRISAGRKQARGCRNDKKKRQSHSTCRELGMNKSKTPYLGMAQNKMVAQNDVLGII